MGELYTKYPLKGLDCANCAQTVEDALRGSEGLGESRVNFAAGTISVPAHRVTDAQAVIDSVDEGVKIIRPEETLENKSFLGRWLVVGASALAMGLGIGFNDRLHGTPGSWAEYALLLPAFLAVGWPVLDSAIRNMAKGRFFDENFLMTIATLGAIALHELPEAVGVMLFYYVGEVLQDMAVHRSRRSIKDLVNLRPDFARVIRNGITTEAAPESVVPGEVVLVRAGERIPLDGKILEGESYLDTSALTGESVPRRRSPGDEVLSGMVNGSGMLTVEVTADFAHGSAAKILDLVENAAGRKAPTERFITKFASYYTPILVLLATAIAFGPPLLIPGQALGEWVYRALILLVISCPCALLISVPLGYFGGLGGGSRRGILVKGAHFLEALTKTKTVVFDKTGTLTEGVFEVTDVRPEAGYDGNEVLRLAAIAEAGSNHPIAQSILTAADMRDAPAPESHEELPGLGVSAVADGKTILAGNDQLLHEKGIPHPTCESTGTTVFVAVDGDLAGTVTVSDRIKEGAAEAILALHREGVRTVAMVTGDDAGVAARVAETLGIDEVRANQLPHHKVSAFESLMGPGTTVFVGDGINDAPVIMRADVGIAMGGLGADAAVEAADVVIMDDDPRKVAEAIDLAKRTRRIILQNIVFALGVKAVFVALGAMGAVTMWHAVFGDVGVALLAVLNSLRAMGRRKDRATR